MGTGDSGINFDEKVGPVGSKEHGSTHVAAAHNGRSCGVLFFELRREKMKTQKENRAAPNNVSSPTLLHCFLSRNYDFTEKQEFSCMHTELSLTSATDTGKWTCSSHVSAVLWFPSSRSDPSLQRVRCSFLSRGLSALVIDSCSLRPSIDSSASQAPHPITGCCSLMSRGGWPGVVVGWLVMGRGWWSEQVWVKMGLISLKYQSKSEVDTHRCPYRCQRHTPLGLCPALRWLMLQRWRSIELLQFFFLVNSFIKY